ncbi:MAG: TIGR04282 family arsenosugar biosynthesis glycosyltransferase [Hyphomicrobiaceae bacterium]
MVDGAWRQRVVVMVRDPVAGAVKTRLAQGLGVARATGFYRVASGHVIERLRSDSRWETWLAVTPDTAIGTSAWPRDIPRCGQGGGDLGKRMQRLMDEMPPGPLIIVGTDIPEISPARVARAFVVLGRSDVVFGPAEDGGYWLVGPARRHSVPRLFKNVRWSSAHTLADTEANVRDLAVAHVDVLDDVDDVSSFSRLGPLGGRRILPVRADS